MSATKEDVLNKLRRIGYQPIVPCVPATIISVEDNMTCTVKFPDGFELADVRLKAGVDEKKEFFVIKPRAGSTVLLASLGNDDTVGEYYVVAVNEIDSIEGLIDKTAFLIDKTQVLVTTDKAELSVQTARIKLLQGESLIRIYEETITIESNKKIAIRNQSENLKSVLESIVGLSESMKVITGSAGSISPVSPTLQSNFIATKKKISDLFEQ